MIDSMRDVTRRYRRFTLEDVDLAGESPCLAGMAGADLGRRRRFV